MTRQPHRSRPPLLGRAIPLALIAALLAGGVAHFHLENPAAGHWDSAHDNRVRSSASHPTAPLHVERVELERAPRCPVCVVRDRSVATDRGPSVLGAAPRASATLPEQPARSPLQRAGDPGRPRGPPLL